jgi:ribosomal protein S1
MANNYKNNNRLLTAADIYGDDDFPMFKNDSERLKYMKKAYGNMSLAKSFSIFYGLELSPEVKANKSINTVQVIELGKTYSGIVKSFGKNGIVFEVPGVKDEIISKENFNDCADAINNYLLNHNNKLLFEVREHKDNKYIVSVISAYYNQWVNIINKAIQYEQGIKVHIDSLVKGGYICHTDITNICQLTGKTYTHSVFIPGSHIVLNIEHDFEKWIGQEVMIVPQKFVEFKRDLKTGLIENSLVGSRKKVLQILGMNNIHDIYQKFLLAESDERVKYEPEAYDGTVTGIINSSNKTGIFVELNDKYITGLMPMDSMDLLDYKPGDSVRVRIKEFEVQEGKDPFVYNKKGQLLKCNIRPVFELA